MKQVLLILIATFLTKANHLNAQSKNLPYKSGFDNATEQQGWLEFRTGKSASAKWSILNFSGNNPPSAPYVLYHDFELLGQSTDTIIDWYVSPPLNIASSAQISFKWKTTVVGQAPTFNDALTVYYGPKKADPSQGAFKTLAVLTTNSNNWKDTSLSITAASDSMYIAFRYKNIGGQWFQTWLDDINVIVSSPSSTYDNEQRDRRTNHLSAFPNPANETLYLKTNSTEHLRVEIYSLLGDKLFEESSSSQAYPEINISNLAEGQYLYRVQGHTNGISTGRFQVIK